jgi:hypothetical protein
VKYFLDNCISFRFAEMLRALGVDACALKEQCQQNISDIELFQYLADKDYVFLSEDRKQLTRIAEATELRAAGISAIYFGPFWNKLAFWGQAAFLVKHWSTIDSVQRGLAKGSIVELKQNGKSIPMP